MTTNYLLYQLTLLYEGLMAMPRTPISRSLEDDETAGEEGAVDASLLPPG